MPKPYPKEFRDEVVRVALNRENGVRIKDIAAELNGRPRQTVGWVKPSEAFNQIIAMTA